MEKISENMGKTCLNQGHCKRKVSVYYNWKEIAEYVEDYAETKDLAGPRFDQTRYDWSKGINILRECAVLLRWLKELGV